MWKNVVDRFRALQVFVKVAERAGFSVAARELAMSPPAVTRSISALEDRIGTRLFVRTTRSVRLTEAGTRFLQDARRILMDLDEAEDAAVGSHAAPQGELHITAPVLFGRMFVTPLLGAFLDTHAAVAARTLYVDRVVSLMDEGLDVAIRIGTLPDSGLTAVRVGTVRRIMFAAPDYLATHGTPDHPAELQHHSIIQATTMGGGPDWAFESAGKRLTVRPGARLRMNTNDAAIELALTGFGLTRLFSYQVAAHLAAGRLQPVLEDFEPPSLPVHILHQEGRLVSARIRAFVDFMAAALRTDPALQC